MFLILLFLNWVSQLLSNEENSLEFLARTHRFHQLQNDRGKKFLVFLNLHRCEYQKTKGEADFYFH